MENLTDNGNNKQCYMVNTDGCVNENGRVSFHCAFDIESSVNRAADNQCISPIHQSDAEKANSDLLSLVTNVVFLDLSEAPSAFFRDVARLHAKEHIRNLGLTETLGNVTRQLEEAILRGVRSEYESVRFTVALKHDDLYADEAHWAVAERGHLPLKKGHLDSEPAKHADRSYFSFVTTLDSDEFRAAAEKAAVVHGIGPRALEKCCLAACERKGFRLQHGPNSAPVGPRF